MAMDLALEKPQCLSIIGILRESMLIPEQSPRTFALITTTLIFPLTLAIIAHSLFTLPLVMSLLNTGRQEWYLLLLFFCYLIFLFAISLLSTAAVVFTVASLYTSKPVSFCSTISAIPRIFKPLFITFLWVALSMFLYNFLFYVALIFVFSFSDGPNNLVDYSLLAIFVLFFVVHVCMTAVWHLASVVSVLEPVYGFAAMKKSYQLLQGRMWAAVVLVSGYFAMCGMVARNFGFVVVGGEDTYGVFFRIAVGVFLVWVLVMLNLVGLLVQSVFYYVCKSYHHQEIDKTALYEHLGSYLGEYVPLKSDIETENLVAEQVRV